MNRTITPEESKKLFEFCRQHYVYHYDLQIELVDHLASSIEEQWNKNPALAFENALNNSFKKFGITGFSKIKEQKQKELSRKYNRMNREYLIQFYRWPKIIMTFAFSIVLFSIFRITKSYEWIIIPYFSILSLGIIWYYYKIFPTRFKIKTKPGKSFMLLNRLNDVQFLTIFIVQIPIAGINFWNILNLHWINQTWQLYLVSLFLITFTIALYGSFFYVPTKIKEHFMEQFGEFAV